MRGRQLKRKIYDCEAEDPERGRLSGASADTKPAPVGAAVRNSCRPKPLLPRTAPGQKALRGQLYREASLVREIEMAFRKTGIKYPKLRKSSYNARKNGEIDAPTTQELPIRNVTEPGQFKTCPNGLTRETKTKCQLLGSKESDAPEVDDINHALVKWNSPNCINH